MLYKDLKIKRPEGTKSYKRNGSVYVYHVYESVYVPEKKYNLDKKKCIGKMIDDTYMNPNDNYFEFYDKQVENLEEPSPVCDTLKIGSYILIDHVLKTLQLDQILSSVHGDCASLIMDLVEYVIVTENSVMQHYPYFGFDHGIFSSQIYDDSTISLLFNQGISNFDIEVFQNAWNVLNNTEDEIYISYDSTNMNTLAAGVEMAEFGKAKDNDEKPQVNLSYAIKHEDGTPLFHELYPGSIIDISQCQYMVDRAKEYGYKKIGFLLDRGYPSVENIKYFDRHGYGFLMMMKVNQKYVKEVVESVKMNLRMDVSTFISNHKVFGKTVKGKLYASDEKERYYHVYYDSVRAEQEKMSILFEHEKIKKELDRKVEKKLSRKEELRKFEKGFRLKYDDNGYLLGYREREGYVQKQCDEAGYFVLVSSKEMDAAEALEIYRNRDSIEKQFRALKTEMGYKTYRVHSQTSLEAKTYVMFVASIVRNYIYQRIKEINIKDKKNYTVPSAIRELEKVTITKSASGEYIKRYGLTKKQKEIYKQFGIEEKDVNQMAQGYSKKMKLTKKKGD